MDGNSMADIPRLIEHAFPLKQTSLDSVHEKSVRHGHISTLHIWPARRPLAACRAALIATLLPDPSAKPKPEGMSDDEWHKEIVRHRQELCEKIGGKVVKKIVKKKMPNGQIVEREKEATEGGILHWGRETENKDALDWFRQEIRKAYGGRPPKVLDPFAGGGAIPLEAMRLGCEATAVDINPVAWFILKCTLEYPQKLAGKTLPLPDFILADEDFMESFYKTHPHLVGRTKKTNKQIEKENKQPGFWDKPDSGRSPKPILPGMCEPGADGYLTMPDGSLFDSISPMRILNLLIKSFRNPTKKNRCGLCLYGRMELRISLPSMPNSAGITSTTNAIPAGWPSRRLPICGLAP